MHNFRVRAASPRVGADFRLAVLGFCMRRDRDGVPALSGGDR
ncbi:hypothetical protein [uncultured Nostoc sp.]